MPNEKHLRTTRGCGADLRPSFDTVLDHQSLGHGGGDVDHVIAVVFLAHAWLAVTANGEAEVFESGFLGVDLDISPSGCPPFRELSLDGRGHCLNSLPSWLG